MRKLSGIDASFLYAETEHCPQHVATVQLLELPQGADAHQFIDQLKRLFMARIHLVPYLTNKLVHTPFEYDHPAWQTDPNFDIDNHISGLEVPAPGGRAQWEAAVAELHEQPFERSRPLWRLVVLHGLEDGRIGYYHAMHHACIDGMTGQLSTELLMDTSETPREVEPPPREFFRARTYSPLELMSAAVDNLLKAQVRQWTGGFDVLDTALRMQRRALEPSAGFGALAEQAPQSRFNKSISGKRSYATGEVSVESGKRIAHAAGCTLNELFLTICGGAIRRYLQRSGELPEASMIAGCPVSLMRPGERSMTTNQLTMMQVSLGTDQDDPARRLRAVAASSRTAKSVTADLTGVIEGDPALAGLPLAMRALARFGEATRAAERAAGPFNVVVSNVPGPRSTLYSAGARMLTHYPVSIPAHGLGVNVTAQSYAGTLFFAITACARTLPDPQALRDDMLAEFAALQDTLLGPHAANATRRPAKQPPVVSTEPARAA